MKILAFSSFLQKVDGLTFLHALTHGSEEGLVRCFREYEMSIELRVHRGRLARRQVAKAFDVLRERKASSTSTTSASRRGPRRSAAPSRTRSSATSAGNIIIIKRARGGRPAAEEERLSRLPAEALAQRSRAARPPSVSGGAASIRRWVATQSRSVPLALGGGSAGVRH